MRLSGSVAENTRGGALFGGRGRLYKFLLKFQPKKNLPLPKEDPKKIGPKGAIFGNERKLSAKRPNAYIQNE